MKPGISIIIVHYHNQKVLFGCLNSINQTVKFKHEVIVVDNDEQQVIQPKLLSLFPDTKYIKAPANIGFGAGCNLGAKSSQANYLLFLNPDTKLLKNSIRPLVDYLSRHKKTAAVSPLLLGSNKKAYPIQGTSTLTPLKAIVSLSFINHFLPNNSISKSYWLNVSGKNKPIEAKVLPGSAFLIKKSVFNKFKGFDRKFFLYFEESDLFKRITDKGYRLFILPQAKLIHYWAKSTPKNKRIGKIFVNSRFYYLKKHFGFVKALLTESFLRFPLEFIILSLILLLAAWLRFFRLPELMTFIGDQGRDYLAARNMVQTGVWPLVGIPSSVPWLKQGAFFIWLIAFSFKLGGFHPVIPAIMTAVLGVLTVYFVYRLAKHWFSSKTALITALITAASPLLVIHSRLAYHISLIPLFSTLFLIALSANSVFWSFFLSGILLQFELTTLPLAILAFYCLHKQKTKLWPNSLIFFMPFLPKLIYDLTHSFKQTAGFVAWLGYRLISFINPANQHTIGYRSIAAVFKVIFQYWQKFVAWEQPVVAFLISILVIFALIKAKRKSAELLLNFMLINFIAFIIHGAPSEAYFPVLLPVFALIIGLALDQFKKPLLYLGFIVLAIYNSYYLVKHDFIPYGPTLSQRLNLVKMIKAKNIPFKLKKPQDVEFESFLDNYRYLFWWQGFPEDQKADLTITVYE